MKKQLLNQLLMAFCMILTFTIPTYAQPVPKGYELPSVISDEEAFKCANYFKSVYGQFGTPVSGGVITREALDEILKTSNCNSITYKFCMDPSGKIAPPNTIFLVLSGASAAMDRGVVVLTEINAPRYNSNDWCPPSCMRFLIDSGTGKKLTE